MHLCDQVCNKKLIFLFLNQNHDMGFPTMWYVRPAKPQIRVHIHTF